MDHRKFTKQRGWFVASLARPNARLRLYCFPYAGGSAQIFWRWSQALPPGIEVCAAQLPGRGVRISESPYTDIATLISALAEGFDGGLDLPFAFYGHSMGAVIAFELARRLRRSKRPGPVCLFASGRRAPQLNQAFPPTYNLPDPDFIAMLRQLDGTPPEVLDNPELMRLMLPALRADFQLVQTYQYRAELPLNCPIIAYGGVHDEDATPEAVRAWSAQTSARFEARTLPGGHFFIHSSQSLLLRLLAEELSGLIPPSA